MQEPLHVNFASKGSSRWSVESAHDKVHVACGFVMGTLQASRTVIFWLHHCNVDRQYQAYLMKERDSQQEMSGKRDYRKPMTPFRAGGGTPTPAQSFSTREL